MEANDPARGYDQGLQDGRLAAIEAMQLQQNMRIDNHSNRISTIEKAMYIMIGLIAAVEFFPLLADFLKP